MALTTEEQALLRLIESSFSCATPPSQVVECGCPECLDLHASFGGKAWSDLADSIIEFEHGSLPLFTEEAFCYYLPAYLPAYLHRAVRDGADVTSVPESMFYSLSPDSYTLPRISCFSTEQIVVIQRYLDYYCGCEVNDPDDLATVEYWRSLVAAQ